jgi:uncharacterized membrane protein YeaQ/YmgE (transglycosylase-associated protein family)
MTSMVLIVFLLVGGIVGWLAALFLKGESFGLVSDIAIGVLGGLIGGWGFGELGITGGLLASIITAGAGAIDLICILRVAKLQMA